jgi:hypothetical protein
VFAAFSRRRFLRSLDFKVGHRLPFCG